jgi:hypothetical protein
MRIRIYERDGSYRTEDVTHEEITDASMIIYRGKYYYLHGMDRTEGRVLGEPIFKEGIAPVRIFCKPEYCPGHESEHVGGQVCIHCGTHVDEERPDG